MLTNKTDFLIGLVAGLAAGAVGYKLFQEHKEQILGSFDSISSKFTKTDDAPLSEEELQAQKEHLEDLIAEQQASKEAK